MGIKKILFMLNTIFILSFVGCGGNSSKEAKELLNQILNLVGIPQEIVINICQDSNDNGFCDADEIQRKITFNKKESIDSILAKVKFQIDGTYLLENYEPTKKILMEIENNSTAQRVTLTYQPTTQELSILQSLIDNNLIKEEELRRIKESTFRDSLDRVLLENIFENQTLLESHNLIYRDATIRNLEYIAEGLRDVNISSGFIDALENCENNSSCQDRIFIDVNEQTQITKKEAEIIAETNSTEGTGDGDTSLTHESDSKENNKNNSSQENKRTEKNVADGYINKLSSPVVAVCYNSDFSSIVGTYYSDLEVGERGKISFSGVELDEYCDISVPRGATIDSNNNGIYEPSLDKTVDFEMKAFGDYSHISPLTTLVYIKKRNSEENITKLEDAVKNFDPVEAYSKVEDNQVQKLLILMEGLKTILSEANITEIVKLNLSSVFDKSVTLANFDISNVTFGLLTPKIENKTEATSKIMKRVLQIVKSIDTNIVDINSFIVNISDGKLNVVDALHNSIRPEVPLNEREKFLADDNISSIIKSILKKGYSYFQVVGISNYFIELSDNLDMVFNGNFDSIIFSSLDYGMFNIDSNAPILISDLISGSVIFKNDKDEIIPTPFDAQIKIIPSRFKDEKNRLNGLGCAIAPSGEFGADCYSDDDELKIREAFNSDMDETFEIVVYKNHIEPNKIQWSCKEDVYKYIGEDEKQSPNWLDIIVLPDDYQDRSKESCGEEREELFFLKKTGQIKSYNRDGEEVLDGSLQDDGFYQKGADADFIRDSRDETVVDNVTMLMWQDDDNVNSIQKVWLTQNYYDKCEDDANSSFCFDTSGDTAITYCNNLDLGGYSDWRLPTVMELQGLVDDGKTESPTISDVFVNTSNEWYWTSSDGLSLHRNAWVVNFGDAKVNRDLKNISYYIRCVRKK